MDGHEFPFINDHDRDLQPTVNDTLAVVIRSWLATHEGLECDCDLCEDLRTVLLDQFPSLVPDIEPL